MPDLHTTRAGLLTRAAPGLESNDALNHIDLAVDLLRTVHMALRGHDFHTAADIDSISDVANTAIVLLEFARSATLKAGEGGR